MFKLSKKLKKDKSSKIKEKKDDCLMCRVSPEIVEQLKSSRQQKKSNHH